MKLYFTDQLCRLADNTILVGLCYHLCLSYHKVVFIVIAVCIVEGLDLSLEVGTAPAFSLFRLIDLGERRKNGYESCDSRLERNFRRNFHFSERSYFSLISHFSLLPCFTSY